MLRTIAQSLLSPIKNYEYSLLLFVPFIFMDFILVINLGAPQADTLFAGVTVTHLLWGIWLYLGLISTSIIVSLHRKIILVSAGGKIRLIPTKVEITYFLYIGAMIFLVHTAGMLLGVIWVVIDNNITHLLSQSFTTLPLIKNAIVLVLQSLSALIVLQVLLWVVLTFPRIAIDREDQKWPLKVRYATSIVSGGGLTLLIVQIITFAPFLGLEVAGEYISKPPSTIDVLNGTLMVLISLLQVFSVVALVTVLSYVYRDSVLAHLHDPESVARQF